MKKCVVGLFAHVDAGKTTLSESLLFKTGSIKKQGRVDHRDAFLDYDVQERNRGITIYSKEARFTYKDTSFVLLDTPGHSDLASEMERTIAVLDIAILIISGQDGVQPHTLTIWNLLKKLRIPTIIFINKMDISYVSKEELLKGLNRLSQNSIVYDDRYIENIASTSEELLDQYLNDDLTNEKIKDAFSKRVFFPVIFGSALKDDGVEGLLELLNEYSTKPINHNIFKARVYKVSRDENKERLTHIKVTDGSLKVKTLLKEDEKVDQIRLYSGKSYTAVDEVEAGDICAIKGLKSIKAGDVLGSEEGFKLNSLEPYMSYVVQINDNNDPYVVLQALRQLEEESPELNSEYNEDEKIITVKLMGAIQIEILKNRIKEKYGYDVDFVSGNVTYKETILSTSEGIGHYEPLRHYAEVHVLLEPLERGSGVVVESKVSLDDTPLSIQNAIVSHLKDKKMLGVLTGSELTDIKISILGIISSIKHKSAIDQVNAAYRAVRHGLMNNKSTLLEPYGNYELLLPSSLVSKAIYDLENMSATYEIEDDGKHSKLSGRIPMRFVNDYTNEVISYSHGEGRFSCLFDKYDKCLNEKEVIDSMDYDPENDTENPVGSIFFNNGAGYSVSWRDVERLAHMNSFVKEEKKVESNNKYRISDEEAKRAFEATSPSRDKKYIKKEIKNEDYKTKNYKKPNCIIVDGYNVIFANERLKKMANNDLNTARYELINKLCDYKAISGDRVICVFDAYKVDGGREDSDVDGVNVIFTKENELADHYIERRAQELQKDYRVSVVTSDRLEQALIFGHGANRISSESFLRSLDEKLQRNYQRYEETQKPFSHKPLEGLKNKNE